MTHYTEQIAEQEQIIRLAEAARRDADAQVERAERIQFKLVRALHKARERLDVLSKLAKGLKPYLCGEPYENVHHGDAYKTTVVTGIEDKIEWWTSEEMAAKREKPYPFVYIIALKDAGGQIKVDGTLDRGFQALVYLDERASVKAAMMRKIMRLPKFQMPQIEE